MKKMASKYQELYDKLRAKATKVIAAKENKNAVRGLIDEMNESMILDDGFVKGNIDDVMGLLETHTVQVINANREPLTDFVVKAVGTVAAFNEGTQRKQYIGRDDVIYIKSEVKDFPKPEKKAEKPGDEQPAEEPDDKKEDSGKKSKK